MAAGSSLHDHGRAQPTFEILIRVKSSVTSFGPADSACGRGAAPRQLPSGVHPETFLSRVLRHLRLSNQPLPCPFPKRPPIPPPIAAAR
jgi:hypothetical protein